MSTHWAAIYARDKEFTDDEEIWWRLRDMDDHPFDPGWERGECSKCHEVPLRTEATAGDILFDIVFPRAADSDAPRIVRSVIPIAENQDKILKFDSYLFLDGGWKEGVRAGDGNSVSWRGANFWRGRGVLNEETAEDWLQSVHESDAYNEYRAGEKPKSIPEDSWEKMIEECPNS